MKKLCWFILLLALTINPSLAVAAPKVYPVGEVIGFNDASLTQKAPAFKQWLEKWGVPNLGKSFKTTFKNEFGAAAVTDITDDIRHSTLVASLHLIRASQYSVPKIDGTTEFHLPVTLSIVFTNPDTGEVIYSFTKTSYASVRALASQANDENLFRGAIAKNFSDLLSGLIKEAHKGYNPIQINTTVAKIWNGIYILDKGTKFGISRDDTLTDVKGSEIQVKYAAEEYAIATEILGKAKTGQKFSKYANQSLVNQLKKPKVLTMHNGWNDSQLAAISNFFDSELSKESAFTLTPVNESLATVLKAIANETHAGGFEVTNQRALPDYILKFTAAQPRTYELKEQGKFGILIYEQYILGELVDKQGRIIYAAVGNNRIEDKNVEGMVFDRQARLEILLKNAVTSLAEQFSKSIKFAHFALPVTATSDKTATVDDTPKHLRSGQSVLVFRKLGSVNGIKGDVFVPIWEASVIETANGNATIEPLFPLDAELKGTEISKGDVLLIDAITVNKESGSETSVKYCSDISPKLGSLDIDDFSVLSRGYGHLLSYSLYDNDNIFLEKIKLAIKDGGFKDTLNLGRINTGGRCLMPVHKAAIEKRTCEKDVCNFEISLAAGYRLNIGNENKGRAASGTKIIIEECQHSSQNPVVQGELSKNVRHLMETNIQKIRYK